MNHVGCDVQPWAHGCEETIDSIKHNAQMFKNPIIEIVQG
jgi:hypothetical protein